MKAMERRGHDVVWPGEPGELDPSRFTIDVEALVRCDLVHVYRLAEEENYRFLASLTRRGVPMTYDHDDNLAALAESEGHAKRGRVWAQRLYASSVKIARTARAFTTTTPVLGDLYRKSGVENVEVIDNYLAPDVRRSRSRHRGIVVGWIAGGAHQADVQALGLDRTLSRLLEKHHDLRVECVGVDLGLPVRYRHESWVPFDELPRRIGGYDIGIAPMTDTPVNRARSSIKVKEYAASGVPWLASPVGGYAGLGPEQGGLLVPDDGWYDALDRLITAGRERKRLGRSAKRWAKTQGIDDFADRWERVFEEART